MSTPPAPTSHTSYQLHIGPMACITSRRSSGLDVTNGRRVLAPSVRPSSTTYVVTIAQKMANQSSTMRHLGCLRSATDLAADQEDVEHAEDGVEPAEADQREHGAARADGGTRAVAGAKQSVHEPRLAAEL